MPTKNIVSDGLIKQFYYFTTEVPQQKIVAVKEG